MARAAGPFLHVGINRPPAPKIEIPDTEIGPVGDTQRFRQSRPEMLSNVVENAWHVSFHRTTERRQSTGIRSGCVQISSTVTVCAVRSESFVVLGDARALDPVARNVWQHVEGRRVRRRRQALDHLDIVVEPRGVRAPDGPNFSDVGSVCLVCMVVLLRSFRLSFPFAARRRRTCYCRIGLNDRVLRDARMAGSVLTGLLFEVGLIRSRYVRSRRR